MRRAIVTWICLLLVAMPALAQEETPQYTAFYIARLLADSGTEVEAEFLVSNLGGDASQPATLELRELGGTVILDSATVAPLAPDATQRVLMTFSLGAFPDVNYGQENVIFELLIVSPEFDPVRLSTQFTLPEPPPGVVIPTQAPPGVTVDNPLGIDGSELLAQVREQAAILLAAVPLEVDFNDPVQLILVLVTIAGVAVVLWLLSVIFRLIFVPTPTFPNQPPPYAGLPPMNPDSIPGRRQLWQPLALHGSMLADQTEGTLHARKLLEDTTGERFAGWRVVGLRASQYDTYGRVTRTQVVAPRSQLRRLNKTLQRAEDLTPQQAMKRVRPVAKYLARQLRKQINKRGAGLPIAVDIKFRGSHGEVNIYFELYQYQLGAWRRLDRWQPEMTVPGKYIYEAYTYTLHGIQPEENMRAFRQRLREDIIDQLTEMVLCTPPPLQPSRASVSSPPVTTDDTPAQGAPPALFDVGETQQNEPPSRPPSPPTTPSTPAVPAADAQPSSNATEELEKDPAPEEDVSEKQTDS